jgi:hypothetical protein
MRFGSGIPSLDVRAGAIIVSVLLVFVAACGGGDSGDSAAPGGRQGGGGEAATVAAATEQRDQAAAVASTRLTRLREDITALQERAAAEDELDSDQVLALNTLSGRLDDADRTLSGLRSVAPESWQDANTAMDQALSDIESSYSQVRDALDAELTRLEAERRMREEKRKQEIRATGLVKGLDGEEYVICTDATVKKVQQALKDQGFYKGDVTGHLSELTMKAIGAFQEQNGLWVSGVPTPWTRGWLFGEIKAEEAEGA